MNVRELGQTVVPGNRVHVNSSTVVYRKSHVPSRLPQDLTTTASCGDGSTKAVRVTTIVVLGENVAQTNVDYPLVWIQNQNENNHSILLLDQYLGLDLEDLGLENGDTRLFFVGKD